MKVNNPKQKPLIILTAGGTGGHIYPAESLAEELERRGYRLALITDKRGKDNYKGRLGQIQNYAVYAGAIVGKSKLFKIKSLLKTCIGIVQAGVILFKEKPVCVVGFGGYASFPASMAAILLGTDLIIHEQNSVMSRTNRFLSKYASMIAQSFRKVKFTPAQVKTVLTGMPVREAIVNVQKTVYPELGADDVMEILVLGGSQGAKVFGDVMPEVLKSMPAELQQKFKIYQQCRKADIEGVQKAYEGVKSEIVLNHFFDNMPELYSKIHLIISRAGASSVSEIAVAGVPSILVPLPTAADDHQSGNAKELGDAKAGIVLPQKDFTVYKVKKIIEELRNDRQRLKMMSDCAKKTGIKDAAKRFADALEKEIIAKHN